VLKFGPMIAQRLHEVRPRPSDRWHLNEMVVRIAGKRMYFWRAVDHEGEISTSCSAPTRPAGGRQAHAKAGLRAKRVVTDKLRSLGAAFQHSGFPVI
jgi:putative transposase